MLKSSLMSFFALLYITGTALAGPAEPVVVFAGSASQPPLEAAAEIFQAKTGIPVTLYLGGSGSMLNQIRLTGQGDVYIPGSPDFMDKARDFGLVDAKSIPIAYLVPAIIVSKGNPLHIRGLQDLQRPGLRIGIADPHGVCVGLYAVEILEENGVVDEVRPNLRGMVESCAKVASMIPLNMVDVVLGWREFAGWNPETMEAVLLDQNEVLRLAYIPAAVLNKSKNPEGAEAFIAFLKSVDGQAIFQKWGYFTDEAMARELAPAARIGGAYMLKEGW